MKQNVMLFVLLTCLVTTAQAQLGEPVKSYGMQAFMLAEESGDFVAYNDCVQASGSPNITQWSAFLLDGGGFEVPSGLLKDHASGSATSVTATLSASNVSSSLSSLPNPGTEANAVFGVFPGFGPSASYNSSGSDWYYEVTFTGLDPSKSYEFVTTANRNSASYDGNGPLSRWTKFSVIGADTYTNASTAGSEISSPSVVYINTGYNTVNGYVARWTGVTASDGTVTFRSENVGDNPVSEAPTSWGEVKSLYR